MMVFCFAQSENNTPACTAVSYSIYLLTYYPTGTR